MDNHKILPYIKNVVENTPKDWIKLTTHRLDIYNESLAKTEFIEKFEQLFEQDDASLSSLEALPTAYDYIRLGHPLSSVLEWTIANMHGLKSDEVISFSSSTMPLMSVLRKNLIANKKTLVAYSGALPDFFDVESLRNIYGYQFELQQVNGPDEIPSFEGSTVYLNQQVKQISDFTITSSIDFLINTHAQLGSVLVINSDDKTDYISAIQHVRRRETIAMTPANCYMALEQITNQTLSLTNNGNVSENKKSVLASIEKVTGTAIDAILGSSGLSVQYAIMMGLIDEAKEKYPNKKIKIIVPPNCYGGTNDQARRVAAVTDQVEIMDLPVDGENDMVKSIDQVLNTVAALDAVPYIIAEIPTNPRVEVPDLDQLKAALSKKRTVENGDEAIAPVFILDQTFCPNVQFLSKEGILSSIRTISYVSGSKFPSGGKCTAGYCVANEEAADLMPKIEKHIQLCDNEATDLQVSLLAEQLPSMNQRIQDAYLNTRDFVNFIEAELPTAKINFVSEELAQQGFTPSVFSLDLPTKGNSSEEKENYKRALNNRLIDMMIGEIPNESKYCVSYGQLKGCYWTIPATSTQGTTKESDKDYIARVSVSPDLDLKKHKEVFAKFVATLA